MKTRTIYKVKMWVPMGDLGTHEKVWYFNTLEMAADFMQKHCTNSWDSVDHLGGNIVNGKDLFQVKRGSRIKNHVTEHYSMEEIELIEEVGDGDKIYE